MDEKTFRDGVSKALDNFKQLSKSILLIYDDLRKGIGNFEKKQLEGGEPSFLYILRKEDLGFVLQYYFKAGSSVKGFSIIAAVNKEWIKTPEYYNKLCSDLKTNPIYPMLLFYGIFEPIDITKWKSRDWFQIFTGMYIWSKCQVPDKYEYGKDFEIVTRIPQQSYFFFTKGRLKIMDLLRIRSQEDLKPIIEDLANF